MFQSVNKRASVDRTSCECHIWSRTSYGTHTRRVSQKIRNSEKYIAHTIESSLLMPNGHYQDFITIEIDLVVSQDKSSFCIRGPIESKF